MDEFRRLMEPLYDLGWKWHYQENATNDKDRRVDSEGAWFSIYHNSGVVLSATGENLPGCLVKILECAKDQAKALADFADFLVGDGTEGSINAD